MKTNKIKNWLIAGLLSFLPFQTLAQEKVVQAVNNVTSLVSLTPPVNTTFIVEGGNATGDGLGGVYRYYSSSVVATNSVADGGPYTPISGTGRWVKLNLGNGVGQTPFAWGTNTAPSITFTNDLDTGIWHSALNTINFSTGGVEQWRIDSNGDFKPPVDGLNNIGDGTLNPNNIYAGRFQAGPGSAGAPSYALQGDTDTGIWSSGANTLNFSTSGSERVRVDSSGNVGIGTTPSNGRLHVSGTVAGDLYVISNVAGGSGGSGGANSWIGSQTDDLTWRLITVTAGANIGNVGIGTTAPTSLLSVNGAAGLSSLVVTNGTTMGSLTVTNNLIVGDAPIGNAIRAIYSAAAELNFPSIPATTVTNLTITVTGAGTNSTCVVSSASGTVATANGLSFSAYVNATNTVTVRAANGTLDVWDPASGSYRVTVFQY